MAMDLTTEAEMLHKVPMFSKLELSKLKLVAFTSELCTYEGGEVLFEAGDAPDSAYVIMDGAVEIVAETEAGPVVEGVLGANELFGELGVLTNSPRSATIRARDELVALRITDEMFLKLLAEKPGGRARRHAPVERQARTVPRAVSWSCRNGCGRPPDRGRGPSDAPRRRPDPDRHGPKAFRGAVEPVHR